jgi:hypothetical protein
MRTDLRQASAYPALTGVWCHRRSSFGCTPAILDHVTRSGTVRLLVYYDGREIESYVGWNQVELEHKPGENPHGTPVRILPPSAAKITPRPDPRTTYTPRHDGLRYLDPHAPAGEPMHECATCGAECTCEYWQADAHRCVNPLCEQWARLQR